MSISRVVLIARDSKIQLAFLACLLGSAFFVSPPAVAQCVECGAQMLNSTIQGIGTYHRETSRVDEETRRELDRIHGGSREGTASSRASRSSSIEDRVIGEVMQSLESEANRRIAVDGRRNAEAWYVNAGQVVGGELGRLKPEYQRRVRIDGRANADAWYLAAAREHARGYIEDTR